MAPRKKLRALSWRFSMSLDPWVFMAAAMPPTTLRSGGVASTVVTPVRAKRFQVGLNKFREFATDRRASTSSVCSTALEARVTRALRSTKPVVSTKPSAYPSGIAVPGAMAVILPSWKVTSTSFRVSPFELCSTEAKTFPVPPLGASWEAARDVEERPRVRAIAKSEVRIMVGRVDVKRSMRTVR